LPVKTRDPRIRPALQNIFVVFVILFICSCSTTKYVPDNKYLLDNYKVKLNKRKIKEDELRSYIKPKPNKRILGFKLYLHIYNLSNRDRTNWINRSLRTIGEEPVIYDEFQVDKTRKQLELYLKNKGYYDAKIQDTVVIHKQKATVFYDIEEYLPYRIGNVSYACEDTALAVYLLRDTARSLIRRNDIFDVDVLSSERERIETLLKNRGYFRFSKEEYLFFEADSSNKAKTIDVTFIVKNFREVNQDGFIEVKPHPLYKIGKVFVHANYKSGETVTSTDELAEKYDTLESENINIIYSGSPNINSGIIVASTFLIPGNYFSQESVNITYRNLSSLDIYRLVNIIFSESDGQMDQTERKIDCNIQLTPFLSQSITLDPEVTNSSGNIGGRGNLIYQHRNLFMGAENFDFRIKGGIETQKKTNQSNFGNLIELGAETSLKIPKFFNPFGSDEFLRKYSPKTSLSLAYNFQHRPEYTRNIANVSFGYIWKGNRFLTHNVNPLELNYVMIPRMSQEFKDWIEGKYIAYSYLPHMLAVSSYNVVFSNQRIQSYQDFVYVRYTFESAGNILYSLYQMADFPMHNGVYELFNTAFAQYLRSDVDFRYYNIINQNTSLVYRFFAGAGVPYKNSTAMPFEKQYFSGGANSVRAWHVRDLGPGSYVELTPGLYPNKTADIKLEANLEYRFNLFWIMKGALFLDAGNIWAINKKDEREGAIFKFDKFYKDIAVGAGFGTRFDFSFFIFRLDLGIKIKDPVYPAGERWWFLANRKLERKDFVINIGIGYPF